MRRLGSSSLSWCTGRGNEQGCAYNTGLVLFNGESDARKCGEAVGIVSAEGVGVFSFECYGYA